MPADAVAGTVRDSRGAPVAGARIELFRGDGTEPWADTLTDAGGTYRLGDVPPDAYSLRASKNGYASAESGRFTLGFGAGWTWNTRLQEGWALSVELRDASGRALPGRAILLEAERPGVQVRRADTGADGAATFAHLGLESYRVSYYDGGVLYARTVFPSGPTVVRLVHGVSVYGRVTDGDGAPVCGAEVSFPGSRSYLATAETDPSGRYEAWGMPAGQCGVVVTAPGRFAAPGGVVDVAATGATRHDIALGRTALLGTLRDRVTGLPIPGAFVTMVQAGLNTVTDDQGRFAFLGIPEGRGEVIATAQAYGQGGGIFDIPANTPTHIELTARPHRFGHVDVEVVGPGADSVDGPVRVFLGTEDGRVSGVSEVARGGRFRVRAEAGAVRMGVAFGRAAGHARVQVPAGGIAYARILLQER